MKRVISIFAAVCVLIPFLSAEEKRSGSSMNSVLASVDGNAVTLMDVMAVTGSKELQARGVYSGDKLSSVIAGYRREAVDELIDNILIHKEFSKYNYPLSNQDIEREVDRFAERIGCRSRTQLAGMLRKNNSSIDEIRMEIRKTMMIQLMLYRQIQIADPLSPRELHEYFLTVREKYSTPEKIVLSMLKIDLSTPDIEKISDDINKVLAAEPGKFDELIKKHAPDSGDGKLGEVIRRDLRPEFSGAFDRFTVGKIAGPIKIYGALVWLRIDDLIPGKKAEFKDWEPVIKADLEKDLRRKVISGYASYLRNRAIIEYFF